MIKTLFGAVREYRWTALLTPLCMMCEVLFDVLIPLLMANLIDYGINAGDMGAILRTGGLLVAAAFTALVFGVLSGRFGAVASAGFAKNLRHDLFHRLQDFSFSNIDRFSTAGIITRLTTDVQNVQNAFQMLLRMACRAPSMLVFALAMAFRINAQLSLVFLGCLPVLGLGLYFIITRTYPIFTRVFDTYDSLNRVVQEDLRGMRVVKSFVREEHETQKFRAISQALYRDFTQAEKNLAFNMPLMQLCSYSCMLLISWFGARMIVAAGGDPALGLSTGQLTSLLSYIMQILSSLMMLSMVLVMLVTARASAQRISELLNEQSDLHNIDTPALPSGDGSIRFENVSFSYLGTKERLCLRGINLSISSGETVGILGGTGSAKSTLVSLIPRLYDATEGTVYVGGVDVRSLDLAELRGEVAMVLQKNVLFSGSIKENLRWGDPEADDEALIRACKTAQADEFIRAFPDGYDTRLEQGGANLSGGQRQRLCIARALLKRPKILILDDSTSAVDTHTDELLRRALRQELPETTKLIIAQRVASVQDADKIIIMESGEIDAVGTHDELLRENAIYREVYSSQGKEAAD